MVQNAQSRKIPPNFFGIYTMMQLTTSAVSLMISTRITLWMQVATPAVSPIIFTRITIWMQVATPAASLMILLESL